MSTGHESFKADILPRGELPTIPTLLTAEGEVLRDGAAIIEHFDAASGRPCQPQSAVDAMLENYAMTDILTIRLARRLAQEDSLEVRV